MTVFSVLTPLLLFFMLSFNEAKGQKKVFMVAGQSNAAGVGDSLLSPVCIPETAFEFLGLTQDLRSLRDPVGENAFGFDAANTGSAWPSFAKRYYELNQDTLVIIQAAKGGSSLNPRVHASHRWDAKGNLSEAAIKKANLLLNTSDLSLDGIIWIQGESDASYIDKNQFTPGEYKRELKQLIQRFRNSFGSDLNFYIVQIGWAFGEDITGYEAVQLAQEEVCKEVPNTHLVYNLTKYFRTFGWMSDYIHYNQEGYNALGKAIAEGIVNLEQGVDFYPPAISNSIYPNPSFGKIHLKFLNVGLNSIADLFIYNSEGILVKRMELPLNQDVIEVIPISMSDITPESYYFCLRLGEDLVVMRHQIIR